LYELFINGHRVGDELLTPGWTSYNRRLQYQTYDVSNLLKAGRNAMGAVLGDGEIFEPHFTYQGFRFIAVSGYPGKLARDSITGITLHSDIAVAGTFTTSKPLIDRLQHNILKNGRMDLNVVIPANSGAMLRVPRTRVADMTESGSPIRVGNGIASARQETEDAVFDLAAGQYRFGYPYSPAISPP
jgi:hypothetical protein